MIINFKFLSLFFIYILFSFTFFTDIRATEDSSSSSEEYSISRTSKRSRSWSDDGEEQRKRKIKKIESTKDWMSYLSDNKKISELSIPGTHDSCALHEKISMGFAACQENRLKEQLKDGIRFFDIRCRHMKKGFAIHHGPVYQHKNFDDVISDCKSFLKQNPTECVIMSVKEEHDAEKGVKKSFQKKFIEYVDGNKKLWFLDNYIPKLGEVRGKIVLFRRFKAELNKKSSLGIDVTKWRDNRRFTRKNDGGVKYSVQDRYKVDKNLHIEGKPGTKVTRIKNQIKAAKKGNRNTLYMNFLNGVMLSDKSILDTVKDIITKNCMKPKEVSERTNEYLSYHLKHNHKKSRIGIIPMDFYNKYLNKQIINLNKFE